MKVDFLEVFLVSSPEYRDRVKGALYGQALGDALGMPYEFDVDAGSIEGLIPMCPPGFEESASNFKPGEWTDDTQQAIALAYASLEDGDFPRAFAKRLYEWYQTAEDVGATTTQVILHEKFLSDPINTSWRVWEGYGRNRPANGGVMRAVGVAITQDFNWERTKSKAIQGCKVTHYDSRCVASAVAVTRALCDLFNRRDIVSALSAAEQVGMEIDPGCSSVCNSSLEHLGLGDLPIGHTYKCLGAGFWALRELQERRWPLLFHEILSRIIKEGGDTDTNAAVAGALMGAFMGFSNIPQGLIESLCGKEKLEELLFQIWQRR
ncbi:MAG: ADP-ribosylglycohydrolase family protein [Bacteroidota bacterium]